MATFIKFLYNLMFFFIPLGFLFLYLYVRNPDFFIAQVVVFVAVCILAGIGLWYSDRR